MPIYIRFKDIFRLDELHLTSIPILEERINSSHAYYHEEAIDFLTSKLYGLDVFKIILRSETVGIFCRKNIYQDRWLHRLEQLIDHRETVNFLPRESNQTSVFLQVMGLTLARIYNTHEFYTAADKIKLHKRECHSKCVNGLYYASVQLAHPRF